MALCTTHGWNGLRSSALRRRIALGKELLSMMYFCDPLVQEPTVQAVRRLEWIEKMSLREAAWSRRAVVVVQEGEEEEGAELQLGAR